MPHVLIVDDEKSLRRTLGEFLRKDGHEVVEAEDAEEALRQLRAKAFDVVVSDIVLPRVSGVELLRRIQATAPQVEVVMMTGEPTVETAAESLRAGAADYLFKPINKAEILRAVAHAARIKSLEDTRRRLEAENQAHRLNLEQLVAERTASLREYEQAVEGVQEMIVVVDRDYRYLLANAAFLKSQGLERSQLVGRLVSDVTDPQLFNQIIKPKLDDCFQGQTVRYELRARFPDLGARDVSAAYFPIQGPTGVDRVACVMEDITEKKLTEAKLLRAQRVESIGSLASGIAHDLNNILAPIVMCAPLLRFEVSDAERLELSHTIEASAQRAASIVRQLLGFARGKEGVKVPLQVRHLIREMAKIVRETFPRAIQLLEECAPDLWSVMADATQLHQVLLNLCVNARDAMPSGGQLILRASNRILDEQYISMLRQTAAPGPYVLIEVEDTGTGMTDDVKEHMFETFFTTKAEGEGTGLGLTTVQGIVKDHQGFITLATAPGKGTVFSVHLPAKPEVGTTEIRTVEQAVPRGHGELVLLVDDEEAILEAAQRAMERQGFEVITARNGVEAVAVFSNRSPEVRAVITDIAMPWMDGLTLCRTLQRLNPEVPVLVSSGGLGGQGGEHTRAKLIEAGVRQILDKPHSSQQLLRALSNVLKSSDTTFRRTERR